MRLTSRLWAAASSRPTSVVAEGTSAALRAAATAASAGGGGGAAGGGARGKRGVWAALWRPVRSLGLAFFVFGLTTGYISLRSLYLDTKEELQRTQASLSRLQASLLDEATLRRLRDAQLTEEQLKAEMEGIVKSSVAGPSTAAAGVVERDADGRDSKGESEEMAELRKAIAGETRVM